MTIKRYTPEDEYAKYEDLRKEDVVALQEWISKQPHLPDVPELQIIHFYHSCYFKIEATKTTIDTYFRLKFEWPEYFGNRDPTLSENIRAMDNGITALLPDQTPEGYVVVLVKLISSDPSTFNFTNCIKLCDMAGMLTLMEHGTANGVVIVMDLQDFSLGHLSTISISAVRNLLVYVQEALPSRLKALHYINAGVALEKLMLVIRPFIKKQLFDMLHTHAKLGDSFYRFVPKHFLPSDYGGEAPSVAKLQASMKKKLLENADFFKEQEQLIGDESKRVGKTNVYLQCHGIDGSFKKLEID